MEDMPQGVKLGFVVGRESPKAEGLGYLGATAKGKGNCRSFDCAVRKVRERLRSG
jgi:hypothetical protein